MPLYVFSGNHLLAAYLRPSNIDGAKHYLGILALLVNCLRKEWPETRIIVSVDSGFCRWKMMRWRDNHGVDYILSLAKNAVLVKEAQPLLDEVHECFFFTNREKAEVV